jgi:hypothetical protein
MNRNMARDVGKARLQAGEPWEGAFGIWDPLAGGWNGVKTPEAGYCLLLAGYLYHGRWLKACVDGFI